MINFLGKSSERMLFCQIDEQKEFEIEVVHFNSKFGVKIKTSMYMLEIPEDIYIKFEDCLYELYNKVVDEIVYELLKGTKFIDMDVLLKDCVSEYLYYKGFGIDSKLRLFLESV